MMADVPLGDSRLLVLRRRTGSIVSGTDHEAAVSTNPPMMGDLAIPE